MNILFVAYYYEPYPGVGAKRVFYWAKNLQKFAPEHNAFVVTATEDAEDEENVNVSVIKNYRNGLWGYLFKSDPGASWGYLLKRWFKNNNEKYDVVLFTGNPFLHFRIAGWLKRKMGVKIVFDYRDPWGQNPRRITNNISLYIKNRVNIYLECLINKRADLIITVNKWCVPFISNKNQNKIKIIDNGFDEEVFDTVLSSGNIFIEDTNKIRFAYAGSFAYDRNPSLFLDIIQKDKKLQECIEIIHIGEYSNWLEPYNDEKWLVKLGQKTYFETLAVLKSCDYGLIFTEGYTFESTTKIFDYIGIGLNILIITNIIFDKGAIIDYTSKYRNMCLIENKREQIEFFLKNNITKRKLVSTILDYRFSRKVGLEKLIKYLNGL